MKITFNTPQGAVSGEYSPDNTLTAAKADVLKQLRLPEAWLDQYVVAREDETLDGDKTLTQLGLSDGATLVVWRVASTRRK